MMEDNEKVDMLLMMAIDQGYVPVECQQNGELVMGLMNCGKDPCHGCNLDRRICGSERF